MHCMRIGTGGRTDLWQSALSGDLYAGGLRRHQSHHIYRSPGLSIGASGAIFGLIGALAAFYYRARSLLGAEASRERVNQMIGLAVVNIVFGFALAGTIDNAAHIGGLIVGGIAGLAMAPQFRVDERVYPPVVVRADRPALGWAFAGIILVGLVGIAAIAVMTLAGQRV